MQFGESAKRHILTQNWSSWEVSELVLQASKFDDGFDVLIDSPNLETLLCVFTF